jgi:hypothetical protein
MSTPELGGDVTYPKVCAGRTLSHSTTHPIDVLDSQRKSEAFIVHSPGISPLHNHPHNRRDGVKADKVVGALT